MVQKRMCGTNNVHHAPSCQNALSSSGLTMHSCSYIAKARLPATCLGLPYPITFAAFRNTLLSAGDASTFLVSHDFSRGCVVEGPGAGSAGCCCCAGGGVEDAKRACRRRAIAVLRALRASIERGNMIRKGEVELTVRARLAEPPGVDANLVSAWTLLDF